MPSSSSPLLILGASARAAAFSALRAGLQPWCADQFADRDLRARCPVRRLERNYPQGFAASIDADRPGPWMYTGGLENQPALVNAWQQRRPLWGIHGQALNQARDAVLIHSLLKSAGLPTPRTRSSPPPNGATRWLVKSRCGAGGRGVRLWTGRLSPKARGDVYWQEQADGQSAAAIYAGVAGVGHFLGMTRQLVGVPWLHARPFQYCGSIGPLERSPALRHGLIELGEILVKQCRLSGLFGVDGVLRGQQFWPVEINPRYTASVEVLEYATGLQALAWHRLAFDENAAPPTPTSPRGFVGKAILFAPSDLTFPTERTWLSSTALNDAPDFADIPAPGETIPRGRPILTFFVHKAELALCESALHALAVDLMGRLTPG